MNYKSGSVHFPKEMAEFDFLGVGATSSDDFVTKNS